MVKAFCSKIETLSDQSIKMSLHLPKELWLIVAPLAYKEVFISENVDIEEQELKYVPYLPLLEIMKDIAERAFERGKLSAQEELIDTIKKEEV